MPLRLCSTAFAAVVDDSTLRIGLLGTSRLVGLLLRIHSFACGEICSAVEFNEGDVASNIRTSRSWTPVERVPVSRDEGDTNVQVLVVQAKQDAFRRFSEDGKKPIRRDVVFA